MQFNVNFIHNNLKATSTYTYTVNIRKLRNIGKIKQLKADPKTKSLSTKVEKLTI